MDGTIFRLHDPKNPNDIPKNDPQGREENPLGRWVGEISINGIKKRVYGGTDDKGDREVKKKLKVYIKEVDAGSYVKPNNMKVEQWINTWLEQYKKASLSDVTYNTYVLYMNHAIEIIGNHQLQNLETENVQVFINKLIKKGLSPRSIRDIVSTVKQCFNKAITLEYIKKNPVFGTELPKVVKKTKAVLNDNDIDVFKDLNHDHPMFPAILIQVRMGLRKGEVLGLRQDDIDLENKTLFIHQAIARYSNGTPYIKPYPKNEPSIRTLPIPDEIVEVLKTYRYVKNEDNLAFTTKFGTIVNPRNYLRSTKNIFDGKVTNHELRHTFITNMCNMGVNPTITAQIAGHADTRMVNNVYNHPNPESLREAINKTK